MNRLYRPGNFEKILRSFFTFYSDVCVRHRTQSYKVINFLILGFLFSSTLSLEMDTSLPFLAGKNPFDIHVYFEANERRKPRR